MNRYFAATALFVCLMLVFLLASPVSAKADDIRYSFVGSNAMAGTFFTYDSTSGYLTFSYSILTATTGSAQLFANWTSYPGPVTGFSFASDQLEVVGYGVEVYSVVYPYSLNTLGTQTLIEINDNASIGTLTITDTRAVPEPSSLMLLGTGALGFFGPIRRKLLPRWK